MTINAILADRAVSAAHVGAGLLASSVTPATAKDIRTRMPFAGVPAYVTEQGSHPPRGSSPV